MKTFLFALISSVAFVAPAYGGDTLIAYFNEIPDRDDVISKLQGTGLITGSIDSFNLGTGTPTLIQLSNYDSVFIFNCCNPINNATAFGNNLADYVDGGGGVVVANFELGGGGHPAGRWLSGGYHPVELGNSGFVPQFEMIAVRHIPNHPVLTGVATLAMGAWDSPYVTRPLAPGAVDIADWTSGFSLVSEMPEFNGKIIGLNLYPPSSSLDPRFWNVATDGDILMANTINYVARVPEQASSLLAVSAILSAVALRRRLC